MDDELGERFGVATDRVGLVRRECGTCHRVFKIRLGERDAHGLSRELARHLSHANDEEIAEPPPERYCPYCGLGAPEDAWLTTHQRTSVEKRADHWQREVRYVQLMQPLQTLAENPNLTFLAVPPEPFQPTAAEVDTPLKPFPLVCCREAMRIDPAWSGSVHCHFCGALHEIDPVKPGFLARLADGGVDI